MQFCHHYHHYSCMPPKCGASICTQYALNHARISLRCVTPKVWNASMLGMQFEFGNLNCAHFGQGKSQWCSYELAAIYMQFSVLKESTNIQSFNRKQNDLRQWHFFEVQKPTKVTRNHWRISAFCLTMLKSFWLSEMNTRNLDSVFVNLLSQPCYFFLFTLGELTPLWKLRRSLTKC